MRGAIEVEQPDAVEVTLTITATLGQWKAIKDELGDKYPAWTLAALITEAVHKISTELCVRTEKAHL